MNFADLLLFIKEYGVSVIAAGMFLFFGYQAFNLVLEYFKNKVEKEKKDKEELENEEEKKKSN